MAFVDHSPYKAAEVPAPFVTEPFGDGFPVSFVGLQAYNETLDGASVAFGASTAFGRHVVCVEDQFAGTGQGRRMELYTLGDSALTANTFDTSGRLLAGAENSDPPDFAVYKGFVGMVDGVGRSVASGDGRLLDQFSHAVSSGTAPSQAQIAFDGTATFTNNFDRSNANPYIGNLTTGQVFDGIAVGALAYFASNEPFGRLRLFAQGTSAFTGTVVWEYWDGGSWTLLSNVTDGTSSFNSGPGLQFVSYSIPGDWATTSVNSVGPHYYMRARITVSSGGITANYGFGDNRSRILRANDDLYDGTAALQKVDDTTYWGSDTTFGTLRLVHNDGSAGSLTVVWEYWDGAAWTALPGLTDGTSNFSASTSPQDVTFTIPGDWAARTLLVGDGVNTDSLFFIRARLSVVSTPIAITSPTATSTFPVAGQPEGSAPVAYDIGTDLAANPPAIIGWGIALPAGVVADQLGLYTYWDADRKIHSRRFDPAATNNYIPAHGEAAVTQIAQWTDVSATATLVGTGTVGATLSIDTSTADTTISIGVDSGPPVFYDESEAQADRDLTEQAYTTCVLRNRIYVARGNDILWSERNEFHQFAPANRLSVAPNDGDEIVGIRPFADKVLIFKRKRIYAFVGEPSVGAAGLAIVEFSGSVGCIAKRTIVIVGDRIYFLSEQGIMLMTAAGAVEVLPVSVPIRRAIATILRDYPDRMNTACAAFDPIGKRYVVSMTGVQEQTTGGNPPGQTLNDGAFVFCERNGQWATWLDTGSRASSLTTVFDSANTQTLLSGDYWGMLWQLKAQVGGGANFRFWGDHNGNPANGGRGQGSFPVTGVVTGGGVSTLSVTSGVLPVADTGSVVDTSMIGTPAWVVDGAGDGQIRWVIRTRTGPNEIDIVPALTGPAGGAVTVRLGALYWHADTGDFVFGDLTDEQELRGVRVRLAASRISASNSTQQVTQVESVDLATAVLDLDFPTSTAIYVWADGTVPFAVQPPAVFLPMQRGLVTRLRMCGSVGATNQVAGTDELPPRIIGVRMDVSVMKTLGVL